MPKDPTRNIDRYKTSGSHINEFEFHKHQAEMAEELKPTGNEKLPGQRLSPSERVAQVTAEARRKAEKLKRRKAAKATESKQASSKTRTKTAKTAAKATATKSPAKSATKKAARKTGRNAG